jgi:bacteriorhodopsin
MELKTPTQTEEVEVPATRVASLDLTGLVKLAYFVIGFASIVYFLLHRYSGATVTAAAEQASVGLLYGVLALILVFGVAVVGFAIRRPR